MNDKEKNLLFWASFISLFAAAVGFVFRSMVPSLWATHFEVNNDMVGALFGASLWPIAVTMILFSLLVDKIGYKISMFCAFSCQAVSVVLTMTASSYDAMWWACIIAGLGHGIVEAVINPLCASIYREEKSKWLNILHASWPAGIMVGGIVYLTMYQGSENWLDAKSSFIFMLLPVIAYGVMFLLCKQFPVDERVENNVSVMEMLKEFGGLGSFLAITFLVYELSNQLGGGFFAEDKLLKCLGVGILGGALIGVLLKSLGKWLFFILCVVMIPLATAEIATDGWIKKLMEPTMGDYAGWALVFSASIMMVLRFFAGVPLKFMSPPGLLLFSSAFSIAGLFLLSYVNGPLVFFAFIFYAVGQTFYWPTVLGLVSEQFPKGGAMTLNTVSAMGLLTVGIFGFPFLGAVQDNYNSKTIEEQQPALVQKIKSENRTFGKENSPIYSENELFSVGYKSINIDGVLAQVEITDEAKDLLKGKLVNTGRSTLRVAAALPISMAIVFGLIALWFRSKGGYKPVVLGSD